MVKEASLRLGACYAELGRWPASIESRSGAQAPRSEPVRAGRDDVARRPGYFEIKDLTSAERVFRETLSYHQAHQEEERIESPFFVAMAQFYQAHLSHRRFRELPLRGAQKQLQQDIETLARDSSPPTTATWRRFATKIRSGRQPLAFNIGALYRELYDTLIKARFPPSSTSCSGCSTATCSRGQLKTLLEKAQGVLQKKNVEWASRVGVKNGWIEKSSEQLEELSRLLAAIDQPVGPSVPTPTPNRCSDPAAPARHSPAILVPARCFSRPESLRPPAESGVPRDRR